MGPEGYVAADTFCGLSPRRSARAGARPTGISERVEPSQPSIGTIRRLESSARTDAEPRLVRCSRATDGAERGELTIDGTWRGVGAWPVIKAAAAGR